METYQDFVEAIQDFTDISEKNIKRLLRLLDGESFETKPGLEKIENFRRNWFASHKFKPTMNDFKNKWEKLANDIAERKKVYPTSIAYNIFHSYDTSNLPTQGLFVNPNDEKTKNAVEWINGERRMIYQEVFGVPCQCFEDMAPWERERWLAFCLQVGYQAVKRIWRNFCESENAYFHMQPGLAIDKIWQAIGALNRGPVHEGASFEDNDLKEPELLA